MHYIYVYVLATIVDTGGLPNHTPHDSVNKALNIIFAITASISLLMIVIGGLKFITSRGDPQGTVQARNTILYAIIGLVVTLAAYSIVRFVLKGIS